MHTVEPIKSRKTIDDIRAILKAQCLRNELLFTFGINSGLRISDILKIRVKDVVYNTGKVKSQICVTEQKTGKEKVFPLSGVIVQDIKRFLKETPGLEPDDFLIKSQKSANGGRLSRTQAYRIINQAARKAGIDTTLHPIGTHTLRKTFGYYAYKKTDDITVIQKLMNHSTPEMTLNYIGITQEVLNNVYLQLNL